MAWDFAGGLPSHRMFYDTAEAPGPEAGFRKGFFRPLQHRVNWRRHGKLATFDAYANADNVAIKLVRPGQRIGARQPCTPLCALGGDPCRARAIARGTIRLTNSIVKSSAKRQSSSSYRHQDGSRPSPHRTNCIPKSTPDPDTL